MQQNQSHRRAAQNEEEKSPLLVTQTVGESSRTLLTGSSQSLNIEPPAVIQRSVSSSHCSTHSMSDLDEEQTNVPDQSLLRKQIIKIQSDPSIPPGEKAKRIQARSLLF